MEKAERHSRFENLTNTSKRIINAKRNLFVGNPYTSKMKPGKEKTFAKLNEMQNSNIQEVSNLFNV